MRLFSILFSMIFIRVYSCQENEERIFDGSQVSNNTFPWMVSIRLDFLDNLSHQCGGSILSNMFVITAANCFHGLTLFPGIFSIKAGTNNIFDENEATIQIRTVSQIIIHPNYDSKNFLNNIALVRVSFPFNMTTLSVSLISLSNLTSVEDMDLITIGWDFRTNDSNSSMTRTTLQQTTVQENVQCSENSNNPDTQLCATGAKYFNCHSFSSIFN